MKKLALFLACSLFVSGAAVAQKKLVDEVNKDISGFTPDFKAAREKLKPALTNPETKDEAQTWYVAGKTEINLFDNLMAKKKLGQDADDNVMCNGLIDGYNHLMKALSLDSVPEKNKDGSLKLDKKGQPKVKTKYSKDIVSIIAGHFHDFSNAGSLFYENKNYAKAYESWEVYSTLPRTEFLGKYTPEVHDTIIGQVRFYQGIAAWQDSKNKEAVDAFAKARENGYKEKEAFDYAMSCLVSLSDNDGIVAIAKEAYPLFGDKDPQYISIMINDLINKEKYVEANQLLDEAIAKSPTNAELYNVKGTLFENQKDVENAIIYFKKAIEIKPDYAKGQFDVGRYYYNKAIQIRDDINALKGAEYQKAITTKLNPLYKEALPYFEKSFELDSENKDVRNALKNIYYFLGDDAKLTKLESSF